MKPFLPQWIDQEELMQVVALARIEATSSGFDPEIAEDEAISQYVANQRRIFSKEQNFSSVRVDNPRDSDLSEFRPSWLSESRKVVGLSPAKKQTPGQKKKFRRNQIIMAAKLAGFSERLIADVFNLPHSRVNAIVKEMKIAMKL